MGPGSVIVDMAAEQGGNCELSKAGEEIQHGGVLVVGTRDIASTMPVHASFLYARNIAELLALLAKDGAFVLDLTDEILDGACVTHAGEVRHEPTRALIAESDAARKEAGH
jgi:H+-translocating NAD(P) transhydrogenase subunit alpha